jgi:DNA-3-methyladenine glycosylase II
MTTSFTKENITSFVDVLAKKDTVIKKLVNTYGYPPTYSRTQSFESLIHIILEQQVSLASAKAALVKLKEKIGTITPTKILQLNDEELKSCYFSRQKIVYARALANSFLKKEIVLSTFSFKTNEEIRLELIAIKGIGNWTVDVYLMMCMQRMDLFPIGDIALINSMKYEFKLPNTTTKDDLLKMADKWQPYRSIAAFIFWNAYIKRKGILL